MRSDTEAVYLDLDNIDEFDLTATMKTDRRILILTEMDGVLLWLARWANKDCIEMPNGTNFLHVRPGVEDLLFALLQDRARFAFAVVSRLGHWNCLPAMRLLLEESMIGTTWLVEETFAGDWYSYKEGHIYTIKKK